MGDLVLRSQKKPFMICSGATVATLMYGFTEFSKSKNITEYTRKYVTSSFEESDTTGMSESISVAFDLYTDNDVLTDLVNITDNEKIASEALRDIVIVDFTEKGIVEGSFVAIKRQYSYQPDSEGDGTDAYTYSGIFKVKGDIETGYATTTDGWETCTFNAEAQSI